MDKRKYPGLFIVFLSPVLFCSCGELPDQVAVSGRTMGTTYHIKYRPPSILMASPDSVKAKIDSVLQEVNRQMSIYLRDSEITTFNDWQSTKPFPVSKEFAFVVERALHWSEATDGGFDITVFPLLFLWGFGPGQDRSQPSILLPSSSDVKKRLSHVGYGKLKVEDGVLIKEDPYLRIDLNAIAKGFGVDAVFDYLESLAVAHMMVEIGGEVRAKGRNQEDSLWAIAIQRPVLSTATRQEFDWFYELENAAMATSGDYRNSFEIDGEIFSHEIDPTTGYPVQTQVASVTVVSSNCTDADALATALMVMGEDEGLQLVESLAGTEAFLILREGRDQFRWAKSSGMLVKEL